MKKISILLAIILTLVIVLTGCGASSNKATMDMAYPMEAPERAPMASAVPNAPSAPGYDYDMPSMEMGGVVKDDGYSVSGSAGNIYNSESNKIIRTANMTIQSTDFDASVAALNQLTNQMGGYFETAEVESGGYYNQYANRSAYYVVRVPKENFVAFRDGTGGIGHVHSIHENTQDVGESYYDTEARLATLITKRDRLLELMEKGIYCLQASGYRYQMIKIHN